MCKVVVDTGVKSIVQDLVLNTEWKRERIIFESEEHIVQIKRALEESEEMRMRREHLQKQLATAEKALALVPLHLKNK